MDVTMGDVPNSLVLIFTKDCISHFQLTSKDEAYVAHVVLESISGLAISVLFADWVNILGRHTL